MAPPLAGTSKRATGRARALSIVGHPALLMSLHAAFAVLVAGLPLPNVSAVLALLALAAGVSWSRLVLRRHTRAEVLVGLIVGLQAGAAAGLGFQRMLG